MPEESGALPLSFVIADDIAAIDDTSRFGERLRENDKDDSLTFYVFRNVSSDDHRLIGNIISDRRYDPLAIPPEKIVFDPAAETLFTTTPHPEADAGW